jgi:DNA-binding LytR/AlgR family response regulator
MIFDTAVESVSLDQRAVSGVTRTVARLKKGLAENTVYPAQSADWIRHLAARAAPSAGPSYLQWLRVQHGDGVQLIAVQDAIYFQASDRCTAVVTASGESLIRKSIRDLVSELDPNCFCRIHRGTIVNVSRIDKVSRSLTGRGVIRLKHRPETLTVSRSYLHLFKQM